MNLVNFSMKILNSQSLTLLLFIIPLSFIAGIAVTEFFVFFCTILFLVINKDKSLFFDKKIIFLFLFSAYILTNAYFKISDDLKLGFNLLFQICIIFSCNFLFLQTI